MSGLIFGAVMVLGGALMFGLAWLIAKAFRVGLVDPFGPGGYNAIVGVAFMRLGAVVLLISLVVVLWPG